MAKLQALECALPPYCSDRKKWRRQILERATQAKRDGWVSTGPFEVVVLLYLSEGDQYETHDIDNRLKDVLDGLQGAFYSKTDGKKRAAERLIRNDSSVCRAIVEKHYVPKKYKNRPDNATGGRLLVRPYKRCAWPLQPWVKATLN